MSSFQAWLLHDLQASSINLKIDYSNYVSCLFNHQNTWLPLSNNKIEERD